MIEHPWTLNQNIKSTPKGKSIDLCLKVSFKSKKQENRTRWHTYGL